MLIALSLVCLGPQDPTGHEVRPPVAEVTFVATGVKDLEGTTLRGRLVAAEGVDLDGVELSPIWFWNKREGFRPRGNPKRADDGLAVELSFRPAALFAFDRKAKTGGVHVPVLDGKARAITIRVAPLVEVRAAAAVDGKSPVFAKATVFARNAAGDEAPIGANYFDETNSGRMRLWLPPGAYRVKFNGTGFEHYWVDLVLDGKKRVHDLGTLDVTRSALERGAIPETWNVTAARGVSKDVTLADYRGRWLLLEFWGFW